MNRKSHVIRTAIFSLLITMVTMQTIKAEISPSNNYDSGKNKSKLTIADIREYHISQAHQAVDPVMMQAGDNAEEIVKFIKERNKHRDTVSILSIGLNLAYQAARLAEENEGEEYRRFAVSLADYLCKHYFNPVGTIIEYDRTSWVPPEDLWRTIPWGVNFRGNEMFDVYKLIKEDLSADQLEWWQESLQKMGGWINQNPVVGSFVFNCSLDLSRLLWRLGQEFDNRAWIKWALWAAEERIRRDVDEEGWIQGEDGGCSGHYHLAGAWILAGFAYESKWPFLQNTLKRIFPSFVGYSTADLNWAGNFGTRSSGLISLSPSKFPSKFSMFSRFILVMGALQDPVAGYFIEKYGDPSWDDNLELWQDALKAPSKKPVYPKIKKFKGLESVVLREGQYVAYMCNYSKSIWARGFINLWHVGHGDWLFSTLKSLPSEMESTKKKLHLGDTNDWAAFPHVRILTENNRFDSQQRIFDLQTHAENGLHLNWKEKLTDPQGNYGGTMISSYSFKGENLDMHIELSELSGRSQIDFHLLKRIKSFLGFWFNEQVEAIEKGELPLSGGQYSGRSFQSDEIEHLGIQIDKSIFVFEFLELPDKSTVTCFFPKTSELHTSNFGGTRVRIEPPSKVENCTLKLRFKKL
jgi:hypothetical protein